MTSLPSLPFPRRRTVGAPEASLPRGQEPARGPVPSGCLVRLRVLDRGVRLTAAGLPDGAFPLQRHQGGVHRLLALLVVPLEEGVEVGGARPALAPANDVEDLLTERLVLLARRAAGPRRVGIAGLSRRWRGRRHGSGERLAGLDRLVGGDRLQLGVDRGDPLLQLLDLIPQRAALVAEPFALGGDESLERGSGVGHWPPPF